MNIGFGRTDITPMEPVPLAGYGNSQQRISKEVDYRIFATCLAFSDGQNAPVLVYHTDLPTPPYDLFKHWLIPPIAEATGVSAERILVSCTHTHAAPALDDVQKDERIRRYRPLLIENMIRAAKLALADLAPATLQTGSIQTHGLNHVRRYVLEDGTFAGDNYGHFDLSPIAGHESEPDRQLQTIKISRPGKQDVILANFQMHPHRNGGAKRYVLSADIIGAFREEMEKDGCLFAYFTGGSGNINGHSRIPEENITPDFIAHGKALANYARRIRYAPAETGLVDFRTVKMIVPVDHSKDALVPECKKIQEHWYASFRHEDYRHISDPLGISSIYHAEAIIHKSNMPRELEMNTWILSIGDVAFVAVPYEMFDTNGMQIKTGSPFRRTFVLTCTNERFAYIPSALGFRNGGYSADLCRFRPGTGELIAEKLVGILKDMRISGGNSQ